MAPCGRDACRQPACRSKQERGFSAVVGRAGRARLEFRFEPKSRRLEALRGPARRRIRLTAQLSAPVGGPSRSLPRRTTRSRQEPPTWTHDRSCIAPAKRQSSDPRIPRLSVPANRCTSEAECRSSPAVASRTKRGSSAPMRVTPACWPLRTNTGSLVGYTRYKNVYMADGPVWAQSARQ